jgi:hypothetical protein
MLVVEAARLCVLGYHVSPESLTAAGVETQRAAGSVPNIEHTGLCAALATAVSDSWIGAFKDDARRADGVALSFSLASEGIARHAFDAIVKSSEWRAQADCAFGFDDPDLDPEIVVQQHVELASEHEACWQENRWTEYAEGAITPEDPLERLSPDVVAVVLSLIDGHTLLGSAIGAALATLMERHEKFIDWDDLADLYDERPYECPSWTLLEDAVQSGLDPHQYLELCDEDYSHEEILAAARRVRDLPLAQQSRVAALLISEGSRVDSVSALHLLEHPQAEVLTEVALGLLPSWRRGNADLIAATFAVLGIDHADTDGDAALIPA